MSTRAQIHVEGSGVYIYKHSDGYPEGVIPWLVPFAKRFHAGRGWDPEYLSARIVAEGVRLSLESSADYERETGKPLSGAEFLGWGVSTSLHGDEAYLYIIRKGGTLEIRRPDKGYWDAPSIEKTTIVKRVRAWRVKAERAPALSVVRQGGI